MKNAKLEMNTMIKFILLIAAIIFVVIFLVGLGDNVERIGQLIKDIVGGVL